MAAGRCVPVAGQVSAGWFIVNHGVYSESWFVLRLQQRMAQDDRQSLAMGLRRFLQNDAQHLLTHNISHCCCCSHIRGLCAPARALAKSLQPCCSALNWACVALCRYESALRHYTTFLKADSWDLQPPGLGTQGQHAAAAAHGAPQASDATASSPQSAAGTAPAHLAAASDALSAHLATRRFVTERCAECYAALADWSGLHALASEHRARSRADASHGAWWGALSLQLHHHFATASYDLSPGPAAIDPKVGEAAGSAAGWARVQLGLQVQALPGW